MKLSMKWLADYTDVSEYSTKEYCDRMTATGSKVEGWEELGDDISGVVVGRVLEVAPHPDADKLVICKIDVGAADPLQIVTGATNVTEGALVPVATDGSHLPGDVKIKKGKLRGAVSEGMLCSIAELGLTLHDMPQAVEDGILILSDCGLDTLPKPGENVKEVLDLTDTVVEFEITPNRPDCLSVIGLARESAVSHEAPLRIKKPEFRGIGNGISSLLSVKDDAVDLCYRYSAAVVKNVRIAPSPMWMRRRLRAAAVRADAAQCIAAPRHHGVQDAHGPQAPQTGHGQQSRRLHVGAQHAPAAPETVHVLLPVNVKAVVAAHQSDMGLQPPPPCASGAQRQQRRVGHRRVSLRHIGPGGALVADGGLHQKQLSHGDAALQSAAGADAEQALHADAAQLLHGDSRGGPAHARGHGQHRHAPPRSADAAVLPVAAVVTHVVQICGDPLHPRRITRQDGAADAQTLVQMDMWLHTVVLLRTLPPLTFPGRVDMIKIAVI